jgi:tetratricopeptide (TPR) repeat protein
MQRYDKALADLNRAIELDPADALDIASRGETYRLMERYEEALADFNRGIQHVRVSFGLAERARRAPEALARSFAIAESSPEKYPVAT